VNTHNKPFEPTLGTTRHASCCFRGGAAQRQRYTFKGGPR